MHEGYVAEDYHEVMMAWFRAARFLEFWLKKQELAEELTRKDGFKDNQLYKDFLLATERVFLYQEREEMFKQIARKVHDLRPPMSEEKCQKINQFILKIIQDRKQKKQQS